MTHLRLRVLLLTIILASAAVARKDKPARRLDAAAEVFSEIMGTPDKAIPQDLLGRAHCIVIVPGLKKGAFIVGGKFGKGFVSCRHHNGTGWGPPAAIRVEGGSFGLQIGGAETDVVMLVMNERGARRLMSSQFTLGGEGEVAAGPVGRNVQAQTDAFMTAEMLSWSRSRGVFAGISLQGATLRQDTDVNKDLYGQEYDTKQIVHSGLKNPPAARKLISALNKYSPRES